MRNLLFTFLIILCSTACKKDPHFVLKAELNDSIQTPILAIYDDPDTKLDTIYPNNGKFIYTFIPDTIHLIRLVTPEGNIIPIFADKLQHVSIKGSFTHPIIEGDGDNGLYGSFLKSIHNVTNQDSILAKAEFFIKTHPESYVSAYLINQYFIQARQPDIDKIEQLIQPLQGHIKDSRILNPVMKDFVKTNNKELNRSNEFMAYFSCKNRGNEYVPWDNKTTNYTLVNFWASWDSKSLTARDSLSSIMEKLPKENFRIINISLDYNKQSWLSFCKEDTKQWIETCDFQGWNNTIIKQNKIKTLPCNILINQNRKIIATNLYGLELLQEIDQLISDQ